MLELRITRIRRCGFLGRLGKGSLVLGLGWEGGMCFSVGFGLRVV